jgi:hypothetical protein
MLFAISEPDSHVAVLWQRRAKEIAKLVENRPLLGRELQQKDVW